MGKRSSEGFIELVILVLVVLALGVGGVYFLKSKTGMAELIPIGPAGPEEEEEEAQMPDDWLTYENETYGYKIRYHPEFRPQGENEPPYPAPPVGKGFTYRWDNNEWCDFGILVSVGADAYSGEIENIRERGNDVESEAIIDGEKAIVFDAMGGEAISRSYYVSKNDIQIRFGYNYRVAGKYSQECGERVKLMVDSFEFVE
jgi:hypothetical protein